MLVSGTFLYACGGYYGPMGRGHMGGYGMYGMGGSFMGIIWIVVFVLIGVGVYHFLKNKEGDETAHDILKKRYAKGEISKKQYEQMKKDLE